MEETVGRRHTKKENWICNFNCSNTATDRHRHAALCRHFVRNDHDRLDTLIQICTRFCARHTLSHRSVDKRNEIRYINRVTRGYPIQEKMSFTCTTDNAYAKSWGRKFVFRCIISKVFSTVGYAILVPPVWSTILLRFESRFECVAHLHDLISSPRFTKMVFKTEFDCFYFTIKFLLPK